MRILLVRLSAIGDCLHAVPLLAALREQLPEATLGWAIESAGYNLLRGHPAVDRFHLYPRDGEGPGGWPWIATGKRILAFRRELREVGYDVVLDVQGLTKSGLVSWWSGAPRRVGFAGAESRELNRLFLTERRAVAAGLHVVEQNLQMLEAVGLEVPSRPRWPLPSYEEEAHCVEGWLSHLGLERGKFAVVNPGTTWVTKTWPESKFSAVARGLVERLSLPVLVTWGSADERPLAEAVAVAAEGAHLAPPSTLRQLAALLGRSALFVGNDTGPLHLAVALGIPSVAIFGATDPVRNGPYGEPHRAVVTREDLPCRPCRARRCRRGDLACLCGVSVTDVLAACEAVALP